jgi:Tol biopolymer transport system component
MNFSPDGSYLAYDFMTDVGSREGDIYIVSQDGKEGKVLIQHPAHDYLLTWTPDGKKILFASDRLDTYDLWAVGVEEGNPMGDPLRIKPNVGEIFSLGFDPEGSFYYGLRTGLRDIYIAEVDLDKAGVTALPRKIVMRRTGTNFSPDWSPDGKYLAYASRVRGDSIRILNLETNESWKVSRPDSDFRAIAGVSRGIRWSPDGSSILSVGYSGPTGVGEFSLFTIDVKTGKVTALKPEIFGGTIADPNWSRDGETIYYLDKNWKKKYMSIMAYEIKKEQTREIHRDNEYGNPVCLSISPDGRLLAFATLNENEKVFFLKVIPVTGGEPRNIVKAGGCRAVTWSPDSKSLLYYITGKTKSTEDKKSSESQAELWRVPVEGGEPKRILTSTEYGFSELRIHPDGKSIAFSHEKMGYEIWAMDNILAEIKRLKENK